MISQPKRLGWLMIVSTAAYLLSFGSQLVISFHFGTDKDLDTYWGVFAVASFFVFYVHPLRDSLVKPVFDFVASNVERAGSLVLAALVFLVMIGTFSATTMLLMTWFVPDWLGANGDLFVLLTLMFLPYIILFAMAEVCNGLLVSLNLVVYQAVIRLFGASFGLMSVFLLAPRIGVIALVVSLIIAQLITLAVSMFAMWRKGLHLRWHGLALLLRDKRIWPVFWSLLGSYFIAQIYVLFERAVMLSLASGLVASYQYGVALVNVIISVLVYPLVSLLWPRFLGQLERGNRSSMIDLAVRAAAPLFLVLVVCCCFVWRFAPEIVQVLFARGAFGQDSVERTSVALSSTVFAAIPIGMTAIFARMLLSQGHARGLAATGIVGALSGMLVVALAGWSNSVALVQWHWLAGNCAGMLVVLAIAWQQAPFRRRAALSVIWWLVKSSGIVVLVTAIAPSISAVDSFSILIHLIERFLFMAIAVAVLSLLTGLIDKNVFRLNVGNHG